MSNAEQKFESQKKVNFFFLNINFLIKIGSRTFAFAYKITLKTIKNF